MSDHRIILNHPWSLYLREPLSSYTRYSVYHSELLRLFEFVKKINYNVSNLGESQVQLTNFIIGTAMEDALHKKHCSSEYLFQWQQLFPVHIKEFIEYNQNLDNDINIDIIIISPDDIFMDDSYVEPLFTSNCEKFKFLKIMNRKYICSMDNLTINVDIFTCPFPQLEKNEKLIHKYTTFIKNIPNFELDTMAPSDNDIKFISSFYEIIDLIASNPLSNMIINSYATFRNVREYDNYGLFPSLLDIANKYKIIATEWGFSENNFLTRIVSKINFTVDYIKYSLSYLDCDECNFMAIEYESISSLEIKKNKDYRTSGTHPQICIMLEYPDTKLILKKINYYGI